MIDRLREISGKFLGLASHHVRLASHMLDRAIASEKTFAKAVAAVAEGRLPRDYNVARKIQGDRDSIWNFASVFFRKYPAGHVSRVRHRQTQCRHDPRDLMDHI